MQYIRTHGRNQHLLVSPMCSYKGSRNIPQLVILPETILRSLDLVNFTRSSSVPAAFETLPESQPRFSQELLFIGMVSCPPYSETKTLELGAWTVLGFFKQRGLVKPITMYQGLNLNIFITIEIYLIYMFSVLSKGVSFSQFHVLISKE